MTHRRILVAVFFVLALSSAIVAQTRSASLAHANAPFLPKSFAGWTQSSGEQFGTDPAKVDGAQAAVLKEDGFRNYEIASYTNDGRKLTIKAAQFQDATGAYGAFTFYRDPRMLTENIGTMAASATDRVLFFRDNILIEAQFERVTAMSAGELRELAASLPSLRGPEANLPSLPSYYPKDITTPNSARYIAGPTAYTALGLTVSPQVIDFSRSPELIVGDVRRDSGMGKIMLVGYPTPQIAIERARVLQNANPSPGATFVARRTGPIVVLVWGTLSERDARSLAERVNYQAEVTWNENTGLSKRDNIGSIVIGAITLAVVIFVISLGAGAVFGFARPVLARFFPGRFTPRAEENEFIRLHLRD